MAKRILSLLLVLTIAAFLIQVGYWAIFPDLSPRWTGFGAYDEKTMGPRTKTLWDWLDLLIVPTTLAITVWLLNASEKREERQIVEMRAKRDHEAALELQKQTWLDKYIDTVTDLLLNKNLKSDGHSQRVAVTVTRTVLRNLDASRKGIVLLFLHDADLLDPLGFFGGSSFDFSGLELPVNSHLMRSRLFKFNLRSAKLPQANLKASNLSYADMSDADLSGAQLASVYFDDAVCKNANFSGADFMYSDDPKFWAQLSGSNFEGANLRNARISSEQIISIGSLRNAIMPDGSRQSDSVENKRLIAMRKKSEEQNLSIESKLQDAMEIDVKPSEITFEEPEDSDTSNTQ